MNPNSIFTKIRLTFLIGVVLFVALFALYADHEEGLREDKISDKYASISLYLRERKMCKEEVIEYINSLEFHLVPLYDNPREIVNNGKVVFGGRGYEGIKYKSEFYMHILSPNFKLLFRDLKDEEIKYRGFLIIGALFIIFLSFYFIIINTLKPLKDLKIEIERFAGGERDISTASFKKDEIAQIANEFDKAVKKIGSLIKARELFLRAIMHELKTPIAKGRIVCELIDDDKQKQRVITVFERLNSLIDDFVKIEKIVSKDYKISKHNFYIEDVVKKALDMAFIEPTDKRIVVDIKENLRAGFDIDLFAMVLKNLIDNGIKYSKDKKVKLIFKEHIFYIVSKGDKLNGDLREYFEPFHNRLKVKNQGLGLGLYIVKTVVDMHKFNLIYEHKGEENIFKIEI